MNTFLVKTSGLEPSKNVDHDKSIKRVMLLHGWGMNSQVWEPIRARLESQYQLLWVDLPGHGFNRHIAADSLDGMADLIATVTPENTHLIGWSLGGLVSQALAQKIPEKISSLTLVTSTPRFSQGENTDWQQAMSDQVLNRFAENLKQDTEKTLKGFIALQFLGVKDSKQAQDDLIKHILQPQELGSRGIAETTLERSDDDPQGEMKSSKKWGGVFLDDVSDKEAQQTQTQSSEINIPTEEALDLGLSILKNADLRKIKPSCPEHWIFAEYDRLIPKAVINDLISLRPDAEITLLEKAGHAPFITHSETFLKHLNGFLEAQL